MQSRLSQFDLPFRDEKSIMNRHIWYLADKKLSLGHVFDFWNKRNLIRFGT